MDLIPAHPSNYTRQTRAPADIHYLVIHYTGNKGDTALGNCRYYQGQDRLASAHYFVDEAGVWQSVRDQDKAWHCGLGSSKRTYCHPDCRNHNSLGIEICMWDRQGQVRQASIDRAVQLARGLMAKYHIPVDHVVRHYDVTHKICPAPMVNEPERWAAFLAALTAPETKEASPVTQEEFDCLMENWLARSDPEFNQLSDIPDSLRSEAQALLDSGAVHGDGSGLRLRRQQLRTLIISKRYTDGKLGD